jgi:transposase
LQGGFVPPRPIQQLRDLTRNRTTLKQEQVRIGNRIRKVLEDANIKLSSVMSDVMGVSGRAMLHAMVRGESDPEALAQLARKRLRGKIPVLRQAATGTLMNIIDSGWSSGWSTGMNSPNGSPSSISA